MTGLDKIVARIKLDTENTVDSIRKKNEAECAEVLSKAKENADAIISNGKIKSESKYNSIIGRADSATELEERKILLKAKQDIISDMISKTLEYFKNLPVNEYFDLVYKMISKYSESNDGVISFSAIDLARLPSDFTVKANSFSKGKLALSDVPADIDGGFVLTYGGVDVNCSFSSLFSDNSEKISDTVAGLLFS